MSGDKDSVDRLCNMLEENDILSRKRLISGADSEGECYEVLVPDTELKQAQNLLIDII